MFDRRVIKKPVFIGLILIMLAAVSGCYFNFSDAVMVTPEIRLLEVPSAVEVESVSLEITGPDMDPVSVTYSSLPDRINISIPEGTDRTFSLEINMKPTFAGTIKSFKGTATADVSEEGTVVTIDMEIGSTKIIVPDAANNRLVQMDDMDGTGWTVLAGDSINQGAPLGTSFVPWDVDFDSNGFFFVANNDTTAGNIYQFGAMTDTEPVPIFTPALGVVYLAVAVDRMNNIVYGVDYDTTVFNATVHYQGINGVTDSGSFSSTSFAYIFGITTDDNGYVYISGTDANNGFLVEKYAGKGTGGSLDSVALGSGVNAGDCIIYDGYLYVTASDGKLYKLNPSDLSNGGSYSLLSDVPALPAVFNAPGNFLAAMNDGMTFLDDDGSTPRLIFLDSPDASSFTSFGTSGTGTGQFSLFSGSFYTPPGAAY